MTSFVKIVMRFEVFFQQFDKRQPQRREAALPVVRQEEAAGQVQALHGQCFQRAGADVLRHRQARQDRNPHVAFDGLADGLGAAHLGHDIERARAVAQAREAVLDGFQRPGAAFARDVGLRQQAGYRDLLFCRPGMSGRDDQEHLVIGQLLLQDVPVPGFRPHHPELQRPLEYSGNDTRRVGDDERDRHLGVALLEKTDHSGEQVAAGDRAAADYEIAGQPALMLGHRRFGFIPQGEQPAGITVEQPAGLGGDDLPGEPVDQPAPEMRFEVLDVAADRRLGQVHDFSGLGKALALDHPAENMKLPEVHSTRVLSHRGVASRGNLVVSRSSTSCGTMPLTSPPNWAASLMMEELV